MRGKKKPLFRRAKKWAANEHPHFLFHKKGRHVGCKSTTAANFLFQKIWGAFSVRKIAPHFFFSNVKKSDGALKRAPVKKQRNQRFFLFLAFFAARAGAFLSIFLPPYAE